MELSTSHHADGITYWTAPRDRFKGNSAIDHLFNRLDGMYPGKWSKNFSGPISIKNWKDECARTFAEEGIGLQQLAVGLRACREKHPDWPPSVPELANLCNPPVDPVAAYHEALAGLEARGKGERGNWSHPAIYWAASGLRMELSSEPGHFIKDRWAAALKAQLARGQWDDIPEPRLQLPPPGKSATSNEAAAAELAKIGALGILKTAKSGGDGKRWAKNIMARFEAGDKSLRSFQVKEARLALGIHIESKDDSDGE